MADQIARGEDTSPRLDNPPIPQPNHPRPPPLICPPQNLLSLPTDPTQPNDDVDLEDFIQQLVQTDRPGLLPAPMSAIDSLLQFVQNSANPEEDPRYKLNYEEILDQVVMILYSGFETVSTTSMMVIKYLHDHPSALQEIRDEHFAIRGRKRPEEPLDWNDYKSMIFTLAVIFETSRLATVVNGVLRKTTDGMELNGLLRNLV